MDTNNSTIEDLETATLAAGCFWCVEAIFQDLKGVHKVTSGYLGGQVENPSYREVCSGTTGHAEACQVVFDPTIISFESLLEIFWTTHDPTTLNRQGADKGTQYRSAIFYHTDDQKVQAEKSKETVATAIWDKPIVTEISPAGIFYPAENYHQNYYAENSTASYCQIVIAPKILKLRNKFADKLKSN
ncbi:MAG: peptide-methionine (S)-S-oxide reductase MsrA [Bacteroidota bacterium]|nr:peptide-methionine (S)-S-oxide reductase MsrA [Bacteroidota bacterium]